VFSVALVVGINAFAAWLSRFFHLGALFAPVSASDFSTTVTAGVGALAVFLALFFTTVGVIASTAYANVPGEIRQLFVKERTSTFYVLTVVVALVTGIGILTFPVVSGVEIRGLTIVLFWLLTVISIGSLAVLGRSLFNFFDPSTLSLRLLSDFVRGLRRASGGRRHFPDPTEQRVAYSQAENALSHYKQLVKLLQSREVQDARGPQNVLFQLLRCWETTSFLKSTIPTESQWYARTATHTNWLTVEHTQLNTAVDTRTGIQPTEQPDPLWVERRLAPLITALLRILSGENEWTRVVNMLDAINERVRWCAIRMQFDEAFMLLDSVAAYRRQAPEVSSQEGDEAENLYRLGVAEREVLGYTSFWLGFTRPLVFLDAGHLASSFDAAVANERAPYKANAPRRVLVQLEATAKGIVLERRTEKARVTPDWWLHHVAARHMADMMCDALTTFTDAVERLLVDPVLNATDDADNQLIAVRIFDLLELLNKMQFHMKTLESAYEKFTALRNLPSNDELWPTLATPDERLKQFEEQLFKRLAQVTPDLITESHDPSKPDLFGQAYRHLFDAAFHAIVEARSDYASELLPLVLEAAWRARTRLIGDLSDQRQHEQVTFGTEPIMDMMELSGYALLMARVEPPGVRSVVEATWPLFFENTLIADLMGLLLLVLDFQESQFTLRTGSIGRTQRQMEMARILRSRGIVRNVGMWGHPEEPAHSDPVVAAYAPDDMMGLTHSLADLFVIDYLMSRPEIGDNRQLPRQVELLQEAITWEQEHHPTSDDTGEQQNEAPE
jgi:hypothetical protein